MPEGDTAWRQARNLHRGLADRVVRRTSFRVLAYAEVDLGGERVEGAFARGKHLFLRIGDTTVHSHLLMEGTWHLYGVDAATGKSARWKRPAYTARAVVEANARLDSAGKVVADSHPVSAVGFSLGMLDLLPRERELEPVAHLGPDLLGRDWNLELALENLRRKPERMIGPALLDQRNLAGIGTIYRAETLFLTGVDPRTPVGAVPDLPRVVQTAQLLLQANKDRALRVTRTVAEPLWCYGRTQQPCFRCGTPTIREEISDYGVKGEKFGETPHFIATEEDRARLSYRCPGCQVLYT